MGQKGMGKRRTDGRDITSANGGSSSYGLCIAGSVWVWLLMSVVGGSFIACLLFVPMLSTTTVHWLARPHLFSWLFLMGTVWLCECLPRRIEWWHNGLWLLPRFGESVRWRCWSPRLRDLCDRHTAGATIWACPEARDWRNYALLAIAMLPGTLINPSGWKLHRHVVEYLTNSALLDQISEFQSFDFRQQGSGWIILCLAICFIGACAALAIRRPERFLLSMLIAAMALQSVRVLPLARLPVVAAGMRVDHSSEARARSGAGFAAASRLCSSLRRPAAEYRKVLRRQCDCPLVAMLIFFPAIAGNARLMERDTLVNVSEMRIEKVTATAAILSTDSSVYCLDPRFAGERKVFFDGRSDFYGNEFTDRYLKMLSVHPGVGDGIDRDAADERLLLVPRFALAATPESSGWRELYRDKTAVLLAGRSKL